jgi:hypothetical protein
LNTFKGLVRPASKRSSRAATFCHPDGGSIYDNLLENVMRSGNLKFTALFRKVLQHTLLFFVIACSSQAGGSKPQPLAFSELVSQSDVIAIIDIHTLHSEGKESQSRASGDVMKILKGSQNIETAELRWSGLAISDLGEWLVFVKEGDDDSLFATYGASSFWKRYRGSGAAGECCVGVFVSSPDIDLVRPGKELSQPVDVYFPGVPFEVNPLKVEGILEKDVVNQINRLMGGE